ncbi:peptidylprolyl isomerase [bacterium]|nr:peptidylprolyl isomerase [bacterium]
MHRPVAIAVLFMAIAGSPSFSVAAELEAIVNGKKLTAADVDTAFNRTSVSKQPLTDAQKQMYRSHVLNVLIDNALLKQFLDHKGVTADPKQVEDHINQFKAAVAQKGGSFDSFMAENKISEQQMREEITDLYQWFAHVQEQSTDQNLKGYFEANKSAFDGSQVRASHILVEFPPTATAAEKAVAYKKIQQIQMQLSSGTDFASLAKQHSDCESKSQGGDVGFFQRKGKMTEPFAKAAFETQKGQVTNIVESEYGYHLIKVTDRKEGTPVRYEKVADDVKTLFAADLRAAIITAMRKQADISFGHPTGTAAGNPSSGTTR